MEYGREYMVDSFLHYPVWCDHRGHLLTTDLIIDGVHTSLPVQ